MNPTRLRRLHAAAALMIASCQAMAANAAPAPVPAAAPVTEPPQTLAIMSLVGDTIDVVTFRPQTGQIVDANTHERIAAAGAKLDVVVLAAVGGAVQTAQPQARIELLAASRPELFVDHEKWFDGDHAALPDDVASALAHDHAGRLLLVTKCRAPARIATTEGQRGTGHLAGLGFYVDNEARQRSAETGAFVTGLVAPFTYLDMRLIDLASGTVLSRERIDDARALPAVQGPTADTPWNAMKPEERMQAMRQLLDAELPARVAALLAGSEPSRPR